jgi:ABC-type dipeptide/oligopeptide/nickel transport system permease component
MTGFLIRRVLQSLVTLLVLVVIIFILARAAGDPVSMLVGVDASPETIAQVRRDLGLDRPYLVQLGYYVKNLLRGDLGRSMRNQKPVGQLLRERMGNSVALALVSMLFSIVLALPLGVLAAVKRGGLVDTLAQLVAALGQAVPQFWLGLILIQLFAIRLGWVGVGGISGWRSYLLPTITLSTFLIAAIIRLLRSSMLEVLDSEFVKMARSKGVTEPRVIWIHALRNGLLPVFTFAAVYFALTITAAVVTETIFNWPGVGRLAFEAIRWRDFPVIQGVVLLTALIVVAVNLTVDVLYAYIDPRIRYR